MLYPACAHATSSTNNVFSHRFFAAVQSDRSERPACRAFTIGQSAIGGCNGIGASPRSLDLLTRLVREVLERALGEAAGLYNYLKKVELDPAPPPARHT